MEQQLSREALNRILEAEHIENLSISEIAELFRANKDIAEYAPDGICQIDPRTGDRVLYNSARARRPRDNRPDNRDNPEQKDRREACLVCQGNTTGVVDVTDLSTGFTFINKNLYPVLYPQQFPESGVPRILETDASEPAGVLAYGFHFLQWSSSFHDKDWHNMPPADRIVLLNRLAVLERQLLLGVSVPAASTWGDKVDEYRGFVSIIKNYGRLVGGSIEHGHQQIGFSNVMPRRFQDNRRFKQEREELFSDFLLRKNPAELLIRDYGPAVLLTPYFMRRPFDMMLLLKDTQKCYLHQLTPAETAAIADGWHDAIRFMRWVMPNIGRNMAYNVVTNNGPGAGLYFEFLPYTQETGGFEHLGLFICQDNPEDSAAQAREFLH